MLKEGVTKLIRDHHRDLLASALLHDGAAPGLADVLGLSPEDFGERGSALGGDDDAVDEPRKAGQARPVREALQRRRQVGTGPSLREAGAELGRQLASGQAADPVERSGGPFPGADRERQ